MTPGDGGHEAYTAIGWGVGLSHERSDIAGAESFYSLEGNMCGTAMRGADALPGSKATSRAKGSYRNLGDLVSGRRCRVQSAAVRIGKGAASVASVDRKPIKLPKAGMDARAMDMSSAKRASSAVMPELHRIY